MKKVLAMLVALSMTVGMLSACGTTSSTDDGNQTDTKTSSEAGNTAKVNDETEEIVIAFPLLSNQPADMQRVQDAMSEITLEKCNATVKLMPLNAASYAQQVTLMLSGSEQIDLLSILQPYVMANALAQKGQLCELDDLMDQYGEGIVSTVGEDFMQACIVNGKLYGVPVLHDLATGTGVLMRKDLVEKYNIDVDSIKSMEDLEPVLQTIKDNEQGIAPFYPGGMNAYGGAAISIMDPLDDFLGVLMNMGQDTTVVNYFETQEYADYVALLNDWHSKGLIMNESATCADIPSDLVRAGKVFAINTNVKPGIEAEMSSNAGTEMVLVAFGGDMSYTSKVNGIQWTIPENSVNPEKAIQVLELLYTDADFLNLFNYGIEGEHYVVKDNGQIALPEGKTAEDVGFNWNITFLCGNEFITHIWEANSPTLWDDTKKFNDESVKSVAMGFSFDNSNVTAEIAALNNVLTQYRPGLENGELDGEKVIPEMIEKMKSAGIDTVIAEKQAQLDKWMAEKN